MVVNKGFSFSNMVGEYSFDESEQLKKFANPTCDSFFMFLLEIREKYIVPNDVHCLWLNENSEKGINQKAKPIYIFLQFRTSKV